MFKTHHRLALTFALISAVIFSGIYFSLEKKLTMDAYDRIHQNLSNALSLSRLYLERPADQGLLRAPVWTETASALGRALGVRATIVGMDGVVLGDSQVSLSDLPGLENHSQRQEIQDAFRNGFGQSRRFSTTLRKNMLYMAGIFKTPDKQGVIRLAVPLDEINQVTAYLRHLLGIQLALAFGAAVLLSFLVSWHFSRPIVEMSRAAKRISGGDFSERLDVSGHDALATLARAINEMKENLRLRIEDVATEKSQLEAVLASMVEGVLVIDSNGRVLFMNGILKDLMRVPDAPKGKNALEIIRHIKVQELINKILKFPGGIESDEISFLFPEERIFSVHAAPIIRAPGQRPQGAVMVFHDMTEVRKLERMRKDFVANVSHELRTPLASIKGYAETLLDGALEDTAHAREFLAIIHADAERLARLINDILDLSRIESETLKLSIKPLDMGLLVNRVFDGLSGQIRAKGIKVLNQIPRHAMVLADEDRVSQVMLNLIDNALKFTARDGTIKVSARDMGAHLKIEVADTGVGIPPEDLPRIFERFYRVDKARSREMGGTGLGLAIVKHIIQAHRGQVSVQSVPGKGSCFAFTLPII